MRTLAWLEAHSCLTLLGLTTWALVPQVGCLELPTMKQSDAERCAAGGNNNDRFGVGIHASQFFCGGEFRVW